MFNSKVFIILKTLHLVFQSKNKKNNPCKMEKNYPISKKYRCTSSGTQVISVQFFKKIYAPISQSMRGQNHVHRRTGRRTGRRTDKQTNMMKSIPQNFVWGGGVVIELFAVLIICLKVCTEQNCVAILIPVKNTIL